MPIAHQAYLVLVVSGFLAFAISLGSAAWWSNRPPRKSSVKAHGSVEAADTAPIHRKAA